VGIANPLSTRVYRLVGKEKFSKGGMALTPPLAKGAGGI